MEYLFQLNSTQNSIEENCIEIEINIDILGEKAIERPVEENPLFYELFQELHDLNENIIKIDRLLPMLLDCLERVNELKLFNQNNSSFSDNYSSNKKKTNDYEQIITTNLPQIKDYSANEVIWQSTLNNFITRIQTIFISYEDITSPIISALQNISSGVRCIISYSLSYFEESKILKSPEIFKSIEHSIQTIFSIPFTINIQFGMIGTPNFTKSINQQLFTSIEEIPLSLDYLTERTLYRMNLIKDFNQQPNPQNIQKLKSFFSQYMTLSKLDYLLDWK